MNIQNNIQKIQELAKQKIEQKATEPAFPPWYDFPTEGEELIGEIVEIRENTVFKEKDEKAGGAVPKKYFYHVKDQNNDVWTLRNHRVIATGLKEAKVGDIVYIKYLGKVKSENKLNYSNYDVVIIHPEEIEG